MAVLIGGVIGRWRPPAAPGPGDARVVPLAWVAAAIQLGVSAAPEAIRDDLATPGLVLTNVLIGAFLGLNAHRGRHAWAARVAFVGWGLNATVILANGAMPVSLHAAEQVGIEVEDVSEGFLYEHENADGSTTIPILADIIPVRLGPERSVQSIGDLFLLGGVAVAAATGTRRRAAATTSDDRREEVNA